MLRSPSPGRGKGIYALCSYMTGLDFSMEPPFECPDDDTNDVAFVKATLLIGSRDAIEEYMACGFFPLSASFTLGEDANGQTPVSKLTLPLPEFPVARLPREMADGFQMRVELAAVNVVGRYTRGEHDACIAVVLNDGHLNRVFEQGGVPYGPCLVPDSEASKEVAKKRKSNAGAEPARIRTMVPSRKAMHAKVPTSSKGVGAASSKGVVVKTAHAKAIPRDNVVLGGRGRCPTEGRCVF
jgi:hypothetical protein